MLPLVAAGYHVVAPDQRGYGRTTGWDGDYDGDVASFRMLNLVRDVMALVWALGYRSVKAVFGHDAGSHVAAWCSLIRPDVFRSVAMMSAPFAGPPSLPFNTHSEGPTKATTYFEPGANIDTTTHNLFNTGGATGVEVQLLNGAGSAATAFSPIVLGNPIATQNSGTVTISAAGGATMKQAQDHIEEQVEWFTDQFYDGLTPEEAAKEALA